MVTKLQWSKITAGDIHFITFIPASMALCTLSLVTSGALLG